MAENQEQAGNNSQSEQEQASSETQTAKTESQTGDPGRTPGKAEGEDDSSATSGNDG